MAVASSAVMDSSPMKLAGDLGSAVSGAATAFTGMMGGMKRPSDGPDGEAKRSHELEGSAFSWEGMRALLEEQKAGLMGAMGVEGKKKKIRK